MFRNVFVLFFLIFTIPGYSDVKDNYSQVWCGFNCKETIWNYSENTRYIVGYIDFEFNKSDLKPISVTLRYLRFFLHEESKKIEVQFEELSLGKGIDDFTLTKDGQFTASIESPFAKLNIVGKPNTDSPKLGCYYVSAVGIDPGSRPFKLEWTPIEKVILPEWRICLFPFCVNVGFREW